MCAWVRWPRSIVREDRPTHACSASGDFRWRGLKPQPRRHVSLGQQKMHLAQCGSRVDCDQRFRRPTALRMLSIARISKKTRRERERKVGWVVVTQSVEVPMSTNFRKEVLRLCKEDGFAIQAALCSDLNDNAHRLPHWVQLTSTANSWIVVTEDGSEDAVPPAALMSQVSQCECPSFSVTTISCSGSVQQR